MNEYDNLTPQEIEILISKHKQILKELYKALRKSKKRIKSKVDD